MGGKTRCAERSLDKGLYIYILYVYVYMYICSQFSVHQPPPPPPMALPLPHGSALGSASWRRSSFLTPQNCHPRNCHQVSLRVQVPNDHTQNLYFKCYFPITKYLIIGYLDLQVFAPPTLVSPDKYQQSPGSGWSSSQSAKMSSLLKAHIVVASQR